MLKKPVAETPCTVNVPPGANVKVGAEVVPLFKVMERRSVTEPELSVKFVLVVPVKVMIAAALVPLVWKSIVPLFTKLPPNDKLWDVLVPVADVRKLPPASTVTSVATVKVRPDEPVWYSRIPPLFTVNVPAAAVVISIVTVWPFAITTLSTLVGTNPLVQVAGALHNPDPVLVIVCAPSVVTSLKLGLTVLYKLPDAAQLAE